MNAIAQSAVSRFSADELALLRRTMMDGATDDEFKLFVYQCERTGLDPFTRQIYAVRRWDARAQKNIWQTQTSIDGLRLTAERSGKYAGQVGPFWCGKDGLWKDVWLSSEPPAAARIGVMRHDFKEPCWGVARFDAYAQKKKDGVLSAMWLGMGDVMVAKCSEALALRKAFPQELSGLYTGDEMAQATVEDAAPASTHQAEPKQSAGSDDPFADSQPTPPKPAPAPQKPAVSTFWKRPDLNLDPKMVKSPTDFAAAFEGALDAAPDYKAVNKLVQDNDRHLAILQEANRTAFDALMVKLDARNQAAAAAE